ncbi:sigma-70 family RNA polymerase sigma factor [Nostoc sp. CHAB 5844]|nr:sigma-70 family RNA polymerase sigma factor [Nostoc sp. CHAB 5844]
MLFFETRSLTLRNHLVELNIGLARTVAHRMKANCRLDFEELFELATVGLIKAVERYNPSQKYFTSFALPYIRGEIQHYVRDKLSAVRVPRSLHELNSKIKKARLELTSQFGRSPGNAEVAFYLGIDKADVEEATKASLNQRYLWSLDSKLDDTDDLTLGDTLIGQDSPQCSSEAILQKLLQAIKQIDNPAIDLIYLQGKPMKEVQKLLKISEAQINALLRLGINQLVQAEICELDEAVQIVSECEDLKNFEKTVGYLLPSDAIAFLQEWLFGQLAVA